MTHLHEPQLVIVADDIDDDAYLTGHSVKKAVDGAGVKVEVLTGNDASQRVIDMIDQYGARICLIVTDIRMPTPEDGLRVIEYAHENHIPLFAVSGTLGDLVNGYRAQCDAIFDKRPPFDVIAFRAAVRYAVTNGRDHRDGERVES